MAQINLLRVTDESGPFKCFACGCVVHIGASNGVLCDCGAFWMLPAVHAEKVQGKCATHEELSALLNTLLADSPGDAPQADAAPTGFWAKARAAFGR